MPLYLVTGGAGFIGSHLAEALLKRGDTVRIVDNLSSGKKANVPAGADFIEGDLADDDVATEAVAGCEYVLHQAAVPSVPRSVKDPLGTHRANVESTMRLLVAARDAGVKRLVFAGSSSTYGNSPTLPKREDMKPAPISPYALQKLIGEQYCQLFSSVYGLETVTTRYFNVFGPRQAPDSPYSGVISLFIKALLAGQSPVIHGDGRQTRDFTYVSNVVDGVLRATSTPNVSGEVINIATGGRISLMELVRSIQLIVGANVAPTFGPPRDGDVKDSQADIFKARKLLGYEPTVPFEEGLRHTVAWFKSLSV
jgi:nucleoside-diphosphate-sugar epimerase